MNKNTFHILPVGEILRSGDQVQAMNPATFQVEWQELREDSCIDLRGIGQAVSPSSGQFPTGSYRRMK